MCSHFCGSKMDKREQYFRDVNTYNTFCNFARQNLLRERKKLSSYGWLQTTYSDQDESYNMERGWRDQSNVGGRC